MTSASCSMLAGTRGGRSCGGRWPSRPSLAAVLSWDEGDDRDVQLAGDGLDPAADLADLLLATVGARGVVHELHVIDHHAL